MPTLDFKGKSIIETYHHTVPHHTLEFDPKLSLLPKGQKPSLDGNLIIEGDNLLALKALLPTHAGKIKCVYIDPPYNTGNEGWVYNDNLTQPQFKEWIGQTVGKEGEDATRHDKWCCMMYPRLSLIKQLLRPDDGVLIVSVDDNEVSSLRAMLDALFGYENFVATIVWQKAKKGDAKLIATTHEYMLIVSMDKKKLISVGTWRQKKPGVDDVLAFYDGLVQKHGKNHSRIETELRNWYRSLPKTDPRRSHAHYRWSDDRGLYFAADFAGPDDGRESRPRYDIIHPVTKKPCEKPSTGWRWDEKRTKDALAEKPLRIHFGPDETTVPCRKTYLKEVTAAPYTSVFYRDGRAATLLLEQMLGPGKMDFPKDKDVLREIVALCTKANDIVLDSFAGSGTTGHAVAELALEPEYQGLRFVLIQQPFDTKEDETNKNNICRNVTIPRLRAAMEGYSKGKSEMNGIGGTYSVAHLGPPLFNEYRHLGAKLPSFKEIAKYVFYTETSRECDLTKINESTGFIGSTDANGGTSYYLFYTPNGKEDRELSVASLADVAKKDKNKNWVIYCERIWLHADQLRKFKREKHINVRPMLVPFNLK